MGVSLAKGGNVSLSKEAPNLTAVTVGLGWDVRATTGADFDLDASALLTSENGKVLSDQHFVFYNNLRSPDGSVEHTGDNLTGEGEGDDESVNVDLVAVPAEVKSIVFPVSIHDATRGASRSVRCATRSSASSTAPTAGNSPGTTSPRMRPPRPRWSSVSCTATVASGSSAPSARATPRAWRASRGTTGSTSAENGSQRTSFHFLSCR